MTDETTEPPASRLRTRYTIEVTGRDDDRTAELLELLAPGSDSRRVDVPDESGEVGHTVLIAPGLGIRRDVIE